jgi:hypothetical protein
MVAVVVVQEWQVMVVTVAELLADLADLAEVAAVVVLSAVLVAQEFFTFFTRR